jgi:transcriptional regulator with XRE-family HTH domain
MITSQQMRAARALLGIDQRQLAELAGLSLPTIQRMEASDGQVRGVIDTLVKVISALEQAGIELIGEHAPSVGAGRGVRLKEPQSGNARKHVPSMLFDQASGANGSAA